MKCFDMGDQLQRFYLDYFNNYLTVDCMAEHYQIAKQHCQSLIDMGREIHEFRVSIYAELEEIATQ